MRLLHDAPTFVWRLADESLSEEARVALADPIAYIDASGFLRLDITAPPAAE